MCESRIRSVINYARFTFLSSKKRCLLIKYINSFTARQLSSMIIYLNKEEVAKRNLIDYINLSANELSS